MKAIAYGAACALLALATPELPPDRRITCALLAVVAFAAFIGSVGRRAPR